MTDKQGAGSTGPYFQHALKLWELGLCPIPCSGKRPLVSWKQYQTTRPTRKTVLYRCDQFPTANIGILTGKNSGITVVDVDDLTITPEQVFERYGETPLIIQTPSGGLHAYYAYQGECSGRLADIK